MSEGTDNEKNNSDDLFSSDVDFLTFLMDEENTKEMAKAFSMSSPIFKTLIESRQEYNQLIKDSSDDIIYGYDVYVVVDGYHYSVGIYPTIKEARKIERIIRMRLERDLKNILKENLTRHNDGKNDRPVI